jgi:hypothetical protein
LKKIILHIGSPKTGSTTIQNYLLINQDKLKINFIDYPLCSNEGRHDYLSKFIFYRNNFFEKKINELINYIDKSINNIFILSDEDIFMILLQKKENFKYFIDKLKSKYVLNILLFLRDKDSFTESLHKQLIVAGPFDFPLLNNYTKSLNFFKKEIALKDYYLNYDEIIHFFLKNDVFIEIIPYNKNFDVINLLNEKYFKKNHNLINIENKKSLNNNFFLDLCIFSNRNKKSFNFKMKLNAIVNNNNKINEFPINELTEIDNFIKEILKLEKIRSIFISSELFISDLKSLHRKITNKIN